MKAIIYKPAPSAMQTGVGAKDKWVLKFEQESASEIDPVMGWNSSSDMKQELNLTFKTCYDAESYAKNNNIDYRVVEPKERRVKPKSYASNFQ